jgi:hypothetical protein
MLAFIASSESHRATTKNVSQATLQQLEQHDIHPPPQKEIRTYMKTMVRETREIKSRFRGGIISRHVALCRFLYLAFITFRIGGLVAAPIILALSVISACVDWAGLSELTEMFCLYGSVPSIIAVSFWFCNPDNGSGPLGIGSIRWERTSASKFLHQKYFIPPHIQKQITVAEKIGTVHIWRFLDDPLVEVNGIFFTGWNCPQLFPESKDMP